MAHDEDSLLFLVGRPKKYSPEGPFRLLDLPVELRQRIYYYTLPRSLPRASSLSEDPYPDKKLTYPRLFAVWLSTRPSLSLYQVSRRISEEAMDTFFTHNTFDVWLPFTLNGEMEIWLLPPLQDSWRGLPQYTNGRWYQRIPVKHWRAMRKVTVVFGCSGFSHVNEKRWEWGVVGRSGDDRIPEQPEDWSCECELRKHVDGGKVEIGEACSCDDGNEDDKRAENFGMLCDLLDVSTGRQNALTDLELVFRLSDGECDRTADVRNIRAVQAMLCDRLSIEA